MSFLDETIDKIQTMEKEKDELLENLPDHVPAKIYNIDGAGEDDEDVLYRGDVFGDAEGNVKFGKPDDPLLRIEFEVLKDGRVVAEGEQIYEISHKERSYFRRFIKTYGKPAEGMDILVNYSHEKEKWFISLD